MDMIEKWGSGIPKLMREMKEYGLREPEFIWRSDFASICIGSRILSLAKKLNNAHPAIISKEVFDAVQEEKLKRSNLVVDENGIHRSNKKYSLKK